MPRPARESSSDFCYHVLNRGNGGTEVFHKPEDFAAFIRILELASERIPMRVLALCLMPTHFHFVLQTYEDGDLSRYMQWLTTSHVRRYHRHYGGSGHVWGGRFNSFPAESGEHLYTVLRYVERNPVRANLVRDAAEWPWSSAGTEFVQKHGALLAAWPVDRPTEWQEYVNRPENERELESLRRCIARGSPLGSDGWVARTAKRLGLDSTIRPRGRPRMDQ